MTGRRATFILFAAVVAALVAAGCQADRGPISINSDDPDLKIQAIEQDADTHSLKDAAQMVQGLSDEDSAIRFYCIQALRRLTGADFGYDFAADPDRRAPAVSRWNQWLASRK
jgi:outer membrane murein-binding lipoprotein Lpp